MRQIALDTETTGIGHDSGHRIIEIGCVELINRRLTGQTYHVYLNPQRLVDEGAFKVHGISDHFLKDKPEFKSIYQEFLAFIGQAELIIHNAAFDLGFLNAELKRCSYSERLEQSCSVVDTLLLARKKHPGQRNNLDALCKRYDIDNTHRQLHGALLDAQILAQLYLAMTGGQTDLFGDSGATETEAQISQTSKPVLSSSSPIYYANPEELRRHQEFMQRLEK
ncbi:MAG: DNA polymerase III subunit epsilon [Legionellaceae bacterium]|nr:DNA polymerase III subunit epsilon [Legionellaceae bacterium]MBP9774899.1 DNA polymerase III subunit epsilon [Legionellaceae bacterium]